MNKTNLNSEAKYKKESLDAINENLEIIETPSNYTSFNSIDDLMEELNSKENI